MIEININLVFTIINLIVLYLLMKKFLFGPILNVMEQRKNMIDQQFASAKDTEEQAYELKGKYEDAQNAYLQVVEGNDNARALYRSLGFQQLYTYWFRVQPDENGNFPPEK